MQALQEKNAAAAELKKALENIKVRGIEDRVGHCKHLQYVEHQDLFVVGYSTLHKAASDNNLLGVQYCLKQPRVYADDFDKNGCCAIHLAAEKGGTDVAEYLIKHGCAVNQCTTHNETALMYACKENRLHTIESLFERGAKITMANKTGLTCFHFAAQGDHVETFNLLIGMQTNLNAKIELELEEQSKTKKMTDVGQETSKKEETKDTKKKKRNRRKSTKKEDEEPQPLNIEAILSQVSNNKASPLHTACEWDSTRVIKFLIDHKVELNRQDTSGETPLHKLGRKYAFSSFRMLVKAGAREDIKNVYGEKPGDLLHDDCKW